MNRASLLLLLAVVGCSNGPKDRQPGDRAPLSAACEQLDGTRCLLPWPSSTYTVVDATSATGLRLAIDRRSVPIHDVPDSLNRANGFSVATPLATGFDVKIDHTLDGKRGLASVKLLMAQPGAADFGASTPTWLAVIDDEKSSASMLVAYPMRTLAYNSDYVVVITDDIKADDGSALTVPDTVKVALGVTKPSTDDELALAAYHAPTRAVLKTAGVDPAHGVRVWDFTTRSADDFTAALGLMRDATLAALDAGALTIDVDTTTRSDAGVELRGEMHNVPSFILDAGFVLDDAGVPTLLGVRDAPFRAIVPVGVENFPVVIYGHGTGGNVDDNSFDPQILNAGAAKLNFEIYGWTDMTFVDTLLGLDHMFTATDISTAGLLQALTDATLFEAALSGPMGDEFFTAVGHRPNPNNPTYAGGSLGGTMGMVHSLTSPNIHYGVLNVPGAGWTHFIRGSDLWSTFDIAFQGEVPSNIDRSLALIMTQGNWDPADGAAWAALPQTKHTAFLVQESMGDPVLPNIGESLVAECLGAVQVGSVLDPLPGLDAGTEVTDATGMTQFRVPKDVTADLSIHGFAAGDSIAGVAAREQISDFLVSVWAGAPKITVPATCMANDGGSCDFSQ